MNNIVKLTALSSLAVALGGCVNAGPQAGFGARFRDNFLLTSAHSVSASQQRCVRLVRRFSFKSGSVNYSLPAGIYKGTRKNDRGYFYYAPGKVSVSSMFAANAQGIYINNQFTSGNLFGINLEGADDRPIRGTVLPGSIFSYLRKVRSC